MKINWTVIRWIIWFICSAVLLCAIVDLVFYDFMKVDEDFNYLLFIVICLILGYIGTKGIKRAF